jgi:L-fucose isomerase-like protein
MIGSILANYFNEYNISYTWFYDLPDSPMFRDSFTVTSDAIRAIKKLKSSGIGVVGGLANGFENMYFDERVLEKKFGTYIQTRHTVEEIVARADKYTEPSVEKTISDYMEEGALSRAKISEESLRKAARVSMALSDFAAENKYDALAVSCWSRFQEVYDVAVCGPLSRLNGSGIVAPCEADVTSAVSMLILNAINGSVAALNDMVSLDESDQSINLWHCGVAARCWADKSGLCWDTHFNIGTYENGKWRGEGVVAHLQMKPGPITICSMDNSFDNLFVLTGEIMADKKGYNGGSGWVNNIMMGKRHVTIKELINTISVQKINHHYPTAFGHIEPEIREFASWKGLKTAEPVAYEPYLQRLS